MQHPGTTPGFRPVPRTGVIYVMTEAHKAGYTQDRSQWANLGQGAPECGELPGGPPRASHAEFTVQDAEYAPVAGLDELREAVAALYNARYRRGRSSQYTKENVAISAGGRVALTRLVTSMGRVNVGHFLPDYTAYEELLGAFNTFVSIPILLDSKTQIGFGTDQLRQEILGRGLSVILFSNPCNPTGHLFSGEQLVDWVNCAREVGCTLVVDEFYSHYVYDIGRRSVSLAEYVDDVDSDPVVVVDGLTKNWRYPGWRVSWTVGPRNVIEAVSSAGSFLDGGCPMPMQRVALSLVNQETADAEADSIQRVFREKRLYLAGELVRMGIEVSPIPAGGFYCWGNLSRLPPGLNTGMDFFRKGLECKVITVPGEFFDIDPGQRRPDRPSRFRNFARFSFGPSRDELERGIANMRLMIGCGALR
jgi:aspartate/methionine/tyrosine aminotransferase